MQEIAVPTDVARKEPFLGYAMLDKQIEGIVAMQQQNEEMLQATELEFLKDMARLPEDQIEAEFGYKPAKIAELKARAKEMGVA